MRHYKIIGREHFRGTFYYIYYESILGKWKLVPDDDINNGQLTTVSLAEKAIDKLMFQPKEIYNKIYPKKE